MRLDPMEYVEGDILFIPQIYDRGEVHELTRRLQPGSVFLDLGANVGFYALLFSRLLGPNSRVLAFEADPAMVERLTENVRLNARPNVTIVPYGVSDANETIPFGVNLRGYRGSSSFLVEGEQSVEVECRTLASLLDEHGVTRVDGMKVDIEGMGTRVLTRFFAECRPAQAPRVVVAEKEDGLPELMAANGYTAVYESALNSTYVRQGTDGRAPA
jgi:FkbM family methyltransferase